ncbi:MAG: FAD binding domain-containing protein [Pseudomonadota bacterium]
MRLPRFELKRPGSLEEAAELLREYGGAATLAAGGTDIFPRMKYRLSSPDVLVSLKGVSPAEPATGPDGHLHIDALMKLADIVRSAGIRHHAGLPAEAAHWVGSAQIRNMATLGGNLCLETRCTFFNQSHDYQFAEPCIKRGGDLCYFMPKGKKCWAICQADTAPALICLEAQVVVTDGRTERQQAVEDLFTGDPVRPIGLGPSDLVKSIVLPPSSKIRGSAFMKLCPREGLEFATVNIAVLLDMEEDFETCRRARIVVGAIAASPVRANKAEDILGGEKLSDDGIAAAAEAARDEIRPTPRTGYSRSYLRKSIETLCRDALQRAKQRIGRGADTLRP